MTRKSVLLVSLMIGVVVSANALDLTAADGLELEPVDAASVRAVVRAAPAVNEPIDGAVPIKSVEGRQANYTWATSVTDPVNCTSPLANSGAYVDLEGYGILAGSSIFGDGVEFTIDFSGGPFNLFGVDQGEVISFTDDGFAFIEPAVNGVTPATHQSIPNAADPNNLLAILWRDFTIVYDVALNHGVSLANLTESSVPVAGVIEFDDLQIVGGPSLDMEVTIYYQPDPSRYQIIFAYDNITGIDATGTVGVEDAAGAIGAQVFFNDVAISNGMAICFDWDGGVPVEMTGFTVK